MELKMSKKVSLMEAFKIVIDPRINRTKKHKLLDIIVVAVCGTIASCDTWVEIEDFGNERLDWLRSFLELPNGIPSHDTFGRVFAVLDPLEFQKAFYNWTRSVFNISEGEIIAIDGKFFNATDNFDANREKRSKTLLGTVNAWATNAGVALAQKKIDCQKKNEQIIMRDLIDFLYLENCIVTMDAAGSHAQTVNKIIDKGGDYCVPLKNNQRKILEQAKLVFGRAPEVSTYSTKESGHGRVEEREATSINFDDSFYAWWEHRIKKIHAMEKWKGLKSVTRIVSKRITKTGSSIEIKYYVSSLNADAKKILNIVRSHWRIENSLHWTMDLVFNEDRSTIRNGYSSENMSLLRKFALNILKHDKSENKSINRKRLKASLNQQYIVKLLSEINEGVII